MVRKLIAATAVATLALVCVARPASAVTQTATVTVAVTAATQATIGVTYSAGSNISCAVGVAVSGIIACTNTATLAGGFRSTKADTGGTSVSLTGVNIVGSGGSTVVPSALTMTCTGGVTGSPTFGGTAGSLASATPLSTSAVNCQSWTGTIVANYSLVVALGIDASQVPSDTYTPASFTATATAN